MHKQNIIRYVIGTVFLIIIVGGVVYPEIHRDLVKKQAVSEVDYLNIGSQREVVIRKMLRENMAWGVGHGSTPYLWPREEGVKKVFTQLTNADIPILIDIIRTHDTNIDELPGAPIESAEYTSAQWVLSFFKEKAEKYVQPLYDAASTDAEKKKWEDMLRVIEVRKIEESRNL